MHVFAAITVAPSCRQNVKKQDEKPWMPSDLVVPFGYAVVWLWVNVFFTWNLVARERAQVRPSRSHLLVQLAILYGVGLVYSAGVLGLGYRGSARAFGLHVNPYAFIALGFLCLGFLTARRWRREWTFIDWIELLLISLGSMLTGALALANQPTAAGIALVFSVAVSGVSLVYPNPKGSQGSTL